MRLFPLAAPGAINAASAAPRSEAAEREVTPSPTQLDPKPAMQFCAYDAALDTKLQQMHMRLLQGDASAQVAIDGHLLAASCPDAALRALLVTDAAQTLVYRTLPDLSQFFSAMLDPQPQTVFLRHLLQQLSPLRRRVRVRRTRALEPTCGVEAAACVTLLFATVVGLYPRACKFPLYQSRREAAVAAHRVKTASLHTQCAFLSATPALLRLALLEYSLNVRRDFAPVEHAQLHKLVPHVQQYDHAIMAACDNLRHTCMQDAQGWTWPALEACAAQMVDRVGRICRATVVGAPPVPSAAPAKSDLAAALRAHVVYGGGTSSVAEIARARVHNALQVYALPPNLVETQARKLVTAHEDNPLLLHNACTKHMCVACLLHGGGKSFHKRLKLRLDTQTDTLICANCEADTYVVRVNVFGKLVRVGAGVFFCCAVCATLQAYDPATPLACARCRRSSQVVKHRHKKRECFFCRRVCMSRPVAMLYAPAACMVHIALCFKHTPPAHAWQYIEDISALEAYMTDANVRKRKRTLS